MESNKQKKWKKKSDIPFMIEVENHLMKHYCFRRNVVTQTLEAKKIGEPDSAFTKVSEVDIYRFLNHNYDTQCSFQLVMYLMKSSFVPNFDPFKEYFDSLPEWDGIDHITNLANHVTTDDQEFWFKMFAKAMVRTIACAIPPHKENRMVMVLVQEGQEMGKSTFIRFLNPFKDKYFTEAPLQNDKDSEFRLAENILYNMEELASLSHIEVNKLKGIISKNLIKQRKPYSVNEEEFPRRCTFWASTNKGEFLTDTLHTRWLCFNVTEKINWAYSQDIDIHKVWAQAYHLYKTGFDHQLTDAEKAHREEKNMQFEVGSREKDLLMDNFMPCDKDTPGSIFLNITEIEDKLNAISEKRTPLIRPAVEKALKQLAFVKDRKRVNGHKNATWGYFLLPVNEAPVEKKPELPTINAASVLSDLDFESIIEDITREDAARKQAEEDARMKEKEEEKSNDAEKQDQTN